MTPIAQHIREGRDAVIAERLLAAPPARNPYSATSKRGLFWQRGADHARAKIDELLRIG
jgi:hypothetical protein